MNIFPSIESCCNKPVRKLVVFFILFTTPFLFSARPIQTYDIGIITGTLIDGNGGAPQTNKLILINDNKIVAIVDAGEQAKFKYKSFIDAHDKFIIPGLIEMHGHVTMTYRETALENQTASGLQMTVNYDRPAAEWMLKTLLDYGITTLRETGDFLEEGLKLKQDIEAKLIPGPYMFTCGPLLESAPPMFKQMSVTVDNETEARKEVQRQIEAGVDFIKVYGSLRPELTRVVIDEAHKRNKRVLGHVGATSYLQALEYGIDAFVHPLFFMGTSEPDSMRKAFAMMKAKHIPMDIQLTPFGAHTREMILEETTEAASLKASMPDTIKKGFYQQMPTFFPNDSMRILTREIDSLILAHALLAKEAGVTLFLGTDFGNPFVVPGLSFHREMNGFLKAGFTPAEVIRIATHDHAEWLGILNRKGTLEAGKDADLVILNANPLEDMSNTTKISHVFREGRMVK